MIEKVHAYIDKHARTAVCDAEHYCGSEIGLRGLHTQAHHTRNHSIGITSDVHESSRPEVRCFLNLPHRLHQGIFYDKIDI